MLSLSSRLEKFFGISIALCYFCFQLHVITALEKHILMGWGKIFHLMSNVRQVRILVVLVRLDLGLLAEIFVDHHPVWLKDN